MKTSRWQRAIALAVIATFLTSSCMSLQGVPISHSEDPMPRPAVKVGESVVVTNMKGEKQKFTVTAVEADALVGKNVRVPYTDIQALDVRRIDGAQTGVVGIVVGVVALVGLLAYFLDHAGALAGSSY